MAPKETPGASAPGTRLKTRKIVSGPLLHFRFHTYLETFHAESAVCADFVRPRRSEKMRLQRVSWRSKGRVVGAGRLRGWRWFPFTQHLCSHLLVLRIIHTRAQLAIRRSREGQQAPLSTKQLKTQQRRRTGPCVAKAYLGISILHPSSNLDAIWISAATLARTPLTPLGDAIGEAGAIGEATKGGGFC